MQARHWRSALTAAGMVGSSLLLALGCSETPRSTPQETASRPANPSGTQVPDSGAFPAVPPLNPAEPLHAPPGAGPTFPGDPPRLAGQTPTTQPPTTQPIVEPHAGPAAAEHKPGERAVSKVDPVQLNGPIFEGWAKPKAAVVLSGQLEGYIEPCGCAGLENQKGGLARRFALLEGLRKQEWPLAMFDLGGLVKRFNKQQEVKLGFLLKGLTAMGYDAIGFGPNDLRLPTGALVGPLDSLGTPTSPYVSANVAPYSFEESEAAAFSARFRIVERGGVKIGVTSVLGDGFRKQTSNQELQLKPAAEALAEVLPQLKGKCDLLVLLAHATPAESRALSQQFPEFDLVVTAGGADEPPLEPAVVEGSKSRLIELGHKGMYVVVLGLFDDPQRPLRYQRVPLDHRFATAEPMKKLLADYQDALRISGFEPLDIRPQPHPEGRQFVGSKTCGACHTQAHMVWSKSGHAKAFETLADLIPARHHDAECLSCHVTGWDPQRYLPWQSGFVSLDRTPALKANGCENCHGPGSAHVAAEGGDEKVNDQELARRRGQMRLPLADAEKTCLRCHDLDNDPHFDFERAWKKIVHPGLD